MANTYTTYKDSGIPWIGEIPSEWNLERLQTMTYEIVEKNNPIQTNNVLSLTIKDGVIPYEEKGDVGNKSKDNYEEYKLAYPETIVLNSMNILIGAVGLCKYFGCVSPVYYVLKNSPNSNLKYLFYILSSQPFQRYLRKFANGILEIRLRISSQDIIKRHIPCPSLYEQDSIANFLDEKCSEIDALISFQEKMIDELKAYKQSVITEAVTKGLDRNVKMKDSGVDWIGEIPKEWKVRAIKYMFRTSKGLNITKADLVEQGYPVISYGQIHSKNNTGTSVKEEMIRFVPETFIKTNPECLVSNGSFIFADTSEDIEGCGNAAYINTINPLFAGYHTVILNPINQVSNKYFAYLFLTDCWRSQIRSLVSGIKVFSISQKIINTTSIIIPSSVEQESIANFLDEKCSEIDTLISIKEKKIEELKDYKKSLIYEYVTGKKRV